MQYFIRIAIIVLGIASLTGCASEKNVQLADNFWQTPKQKIAVVSAKAPKPQLYKIGNQGLLDIAINSMMTKSLDNNIGNEDLSWYQSIPETFAAKLKKRNMYAKAYTQQFASDETNYSTFANQVDTNKLLVIKLIAVGAKRDYYAFVPTSAPQAFCVLSGELINTQNKEVLWRYKTVITQPVEGIWDQPPNYPNLNNAMKMAVNTAQQELLDSFFSGH